MTRTDRPHMFIKELQMYLDYISELIVAHNMTPTDKQSKYIEKFAANLKEGIAYYQNLMAQGTTYFQSSKTIILDQLKQGMLSIDRELATITPVEVA